MTAKSAPTAEPRRHLTVLDSVCVIVGTIIGAGIYRTTPDIAANVSGPQALIVVWLLGGLLALIGSLCYAELATTYPHAGGDYVYLTRAYGGPVGFMFAWCEFWIVRPGNVGAMAFVFAEYSLKLLPAAFARCPVWVPAMVVVVTLSLIHLLGVTIGKWTQNVLSITKVGGLFAVCGVAFVLLSPVPAPPPVDPPSFPGSGFGIAMVLVLFTFGGWNDVSFVASEVRQPERNIVRSLLLGSLTVTLIYVLINLALLWGLGFEGVQNSKVVAADLMQRALGRRGEMAISLLICLSCLGAMHAMLFTGSRVYYALGRTDARFGWLGHWSVRWQTPARAIILQGVVVAAILVGFGMYENGFERVVVFTAPPFWLFFLGSGVGLIVLRYREPHQPRPFRVPWYPVVPLLFCLSCAWMLWKSSVYAVTRGYAEGLWTVAVFIIGLALSRRFGRRT